MVVRQLNTLAWDYKHNVRTLKPSWNTFMLARKIFTRSHETDASSRHNFRTSRRYDEAAVRTRTRRTIPSWSGKVSVTKAFGQLPRRTASSLTSTRSPTRRLREGCSHVWRSCSIGRYCFSQRAQNRLASNWTLLQDRR